MSRDQQAANIIPAVVVWFVMQEKRYCHAFAANSDQQQAAQTGNAAHVSAVTDYPINESTNVPPVAMTLMEGGSMSAIQRKPRGFIVVFDRLDPAGDSAHRLCRRLANAAVSGCVLDAYTDNGQVQQQVRASIRAEK
jgi:hypothetical protein